MRKLHISILTAVLILLCINLVVPFSASAEKMKVIIGYFRPPGAPDEDNIRVLGGDVRYRFSIISAISASLPEPAIEALRKNPNIKYVEPDYVVQALETTPNDPAYGALWGMEKIAAPQAWDITTGSADVVIAVIDTGVDYTHTDLAANMWVNPGEFDKNPGVDDDGNGHIDDIYGCDFVNDDSDPMDDQYHGTHCAGTIAAVGNNGVGVAGVNWHASIMALKFLNSSGRGYTTDAIRSLEYIQMMHDEKGINVIASSNSWGGGGPSFALYEAIQAAGDSGMLFVAAAGNDYGSDNDLRPHYPASYDLDNIIAVAATNDKDQLASFSNIGPESVDLAAPGEAIYSTMPGDVYGSLSGTSMATPHVSGVVGLVKAAFPTLDHLSIKARILDSVDPLSSLAGKVLTGGRLNAYGAITETDDTIPPAPVADLTVIGVNVNSVTLQWIATGDDGGIGTARRYDIRYSEDAPVSNPPELSWWETATKVPDEPRPQSAGSIETFTVSGLTPGRTYYFSLNVMDDVGLGSGLSLYETGQTGPAEIAFEDDMESGPGNWVIQSDPDTSIDWGLTNDFHHTYMNSWADSPDGEYEDYSDTSITTAVPIDLTGLSSAVLSFWHEYAIETGYDFGYVQVSSDGGSNWLDVATYTGFSLWENVTIDLSAYDGQTIYLRFRMVTDFIYTGDGWNIDDVVVYGQSDSTPPAAPSNLTATAGDSQVTLNWTANTESDLGGYNVYRNDPPDYNTGYVKIGSTPATENSYTDNGVTNDDTYYYVVTAVDTSGHESTTYSNEASATPHEIVSGTDSLDVITSSGGTSAVSMVTANDDVRWAITSKSFTSFTFEAYGGGTITSLILYVEHIEDGGFKGSPQWSVSDGVTSIATGSLSLRTQEGVDSIDLTSYVVGSTALNLALTISNTYPKSKNVNVDHIYAEVEWGTPEEPPPPPPPSGSIQVAGIEIAGSLLVRGNNNFYRAEARVTLSPTVSAATAYGDWSGVYNIANVSDDTDGSGVAVFTTDWVKNGGTFTFTVTGVEGYTLVPSVSNSATANIPLAAPALSYSTGVANPFPTPANPETWIPFTLAEPEWVTIRIYDATGRIVRTLELGHRSPGAYMTKEKAAYWDGRNETGETVSSGIYFCTMEAGAIVATKRLVIIR